MLITLDTSGVRYVLESIETSPFGNLAIIFWCSFLLLTLHGLRKAPLPGFARPLQWVGRNSLGIFLIHRVLFLKILAPLRFHFGSYLHLPMTNTTVEAIAYFSMTGLAYWLMLRNKAWSLLNGFKAPS
jgi:surface polysaccharide O-acyltransferase-like enzyme